MKLFEDCALVCVLDCDVDCLELDLGSAPWDCVWHWCLQRGLRKAFVLLGLRLFCHSRRHAKDKQKMSASAAPPDPGAVAPAAAALQALEDKVQRLEIELEGERSRRIELEGEVAVLSAQLREARGSRPRRQDALLLAALRA